MYDWSIKSFIYPSFFQACQIGTTKGGQAQKRVVQEQKSGDKKGRVEGMCGKWMWGISRMIDDRMSACFQSKPSLLKSLKIKEKLLNMKV